MPKLSDTKIRAAKPRQKPYKLFDSDGLFLIVNPGGSKWWRQRYRYAGREQLLSLGVYDAISLADAREKRGGSQAAACRAHRRQGKTAFAPQGDDNQAPHPSI